MPLALFLGASSSESSDELELDESELDESESDESESESDELSDESSAGPKHGYEIAAFAAA